jgi:hypothetical protein
MNGDPERHSVIRTGQRKPYVKATHMQIEQRTEAAAVLCFCGFSKSKIRRVFKKKYRVKWRQTDRYMARARVCARERFP